MLTSAPSSFSLVTISPPDSGARRDPWEPPTMPSLQPEAAARSPDRTSGQDLEYPELRIGPPRPRLPRFPPRQVGVRGIVVRSHIVRNSDHPMVKVPTGVIAGRSGGARSLESWTTATSSHGPCLENSQRAVPDNWPGHGEIVLSGGTRVVWRSLQKTGCQWSGETSVRAVIELETRATVGGRVGSATVL